jgi:hypothetical protein
VLRRGEEKEGERVGNEGRSSRDDEIGMGAEPLA